MAFMTRAAHVIQWHIQSEANSREQANRKKCAPVRIAGCKKACMKPESLVAQTKLSPLTPPTYSPCGQFLPWKSLPPPCYNRGMILSQEICVSPCLQVSLSPCPSCPSCASWLTHHPRTAWGATSSLKSEISTRADQLLMQLSDTQLQEHPAATPCGAAGKQCTCFRPIVSPTRFLAPPARS